MPIGIIPLNETKYDDMVLIMEHLQNYVPLVSTEERVPCRDPQEVTVHVDNFHYTLFGGDQLTVARARGSQRVRSNSERPRDRLEGLQPVCEDWHAKSVLLEVGVHNYD